MKKDEQFQTLCRLAKLSNAAAKELTGAGRALAYRIKSEILSTLILEGSASINGVSVNDTLGLNILDDPPFQLHVPLKRLRPKAQAAAKQKLGSVPVVAPLGELLRQRQ